MDTNLERRSYLKRIKSLSTCKIIFSNVFLKWRINLMVAFKTYRTKMKINKNKIKMMKGTK